MNTTLELDRTDERPEGARSRRPQRPVEAGARTTVAPTWRRLLLPLLCGAALAGCAGGAAAWAPTDDTDEPTPAPAATSTCDAAPRVADHFVPGLRHMPVS